MAALNIRLEWRHSRHMNSVLHLMMVMIMLRLYLLRLWILVLLHHRMLCRVHLLFFLFMRAMTFVATVAITGIETEADFCKLERLLRCHLRLLSILEFLVVHTLGVDPGAELTRVLGYHGVSKFGLVLTEFRVINIFRCVRKAQ